MSGGFKLFCWVEGDRPDRAFSVNVSRGYAVSDLKKVIYLKVAKRKGFRDYNPDDLDIYKVRPLMVLVGFDILTFYKIDNVNINCETFNQTSADSIVLQEGQELGGVRDIVNIWGNGPDCHVLNVAVRRPDGEWQSLGP